MKRLAILGASGHGKVIADIAELTGWEEIVFFDDVWPKIQSNGCWSVKGNTEILLNCSHEFQGAIVAIGDNKIRLEKHQLFTEKGVALVSLIHPSAVMSRYAQLGVGSVVMAGAVINSDAVLGDVCIVNTGATVDHDCIIDNAVHISPGAHIAGGAKIGRCCWIGIGSVIKQLVVIGDDVIVGAGAAVVMSAVPNNSTLVGVPAQIIQSAVKKSA